MPPSRKQQVVEILKSLETKDPVPFAYVNPNKYIQHNLQVGPGPAGVAALIQNMPPDAAVNTIRVFEDGDYVFAHTEYNFFGPRIGFDIFRFEDGLIVEHWDNLQETATEPSPSGHTMIYSALQTARSLSTGIRSKRFHLAINGKIATVSSSAVRGRTYASRHVWKKIGGAFFSAGVFLTCACSQGKLSGCVDTYANAERLSWTHSTHSTRKGFFDIRAPAPSRQH